MVVARLDLNREGRLCDPAKEFFAESIDDRGARSPTLTNRATGVSMPTSRRVMRQMSFIRDWGNRFVVPIPEVRVLD